MTLDIHFLCIPHGLYITPLDLFLHKRASTSTTTSTSTMATAVITPTTAPITVPPTLDDDEVLLEPMTDVRV